MEPRTNQKDKSFEDYADQVRNDHYLHRFVHIAVALWAGWAWGWLWGIGLFVALYAVIFVTNEIIMLTSGSLKLIRFNRWLWLVVAFVYVVVTTASIEQVP
jgi:hypothetical protein